MMDGKGDNEAEEVEEADVEVPRPLVGDDVLPAGKDDGRELEVLWDVAGVEELESPSMAGRSKLQS